MDHFVSFTIDVYSCVFLASEVERIIRVVDIIPIPKSGVSVLGLINIHGNLCTVLDLRQLFVPEIKEFTLSDHIVITNKNGKQLGFLVEKITGMSERDEKDLATLESIQSRQKNYSGLSVFKDGTFFFSDPEDCLVEMNMDKNSFLDKV